MVELPTGNVSRVGRGACLRSRFQISPKRKTRPHFYNPFSVKLCPFAVVDTPHGPWLSPGAESLPRPLARQGRFAPPPAVPSASLTGSLGLGGPTAWPGRRTLRWGRTKNTVENFRNGRVGRVGGIFFQNPSACKPLILLYSGRVGRVGRVKNNYVYARKASDLTSKPGKLVQPVRYSGKSMICAEARRGSNPSDTPQSASPGGHSVSGNLSHHLSLSSGNRLKIQPR